MEKTKNRQESIYIRENEIKDMSKKIQIGILTVFLLGSLLLSAFAVVGVTSPPYVVNPWETPIPLRLAGGLSTYSFSVIQGGNTILYPGETFTPAMMTLKNTGTVTLPDVVYTDGTSSLLYKLWFVLDSKGALYYQGAAEQVSLSPQAATNFTISLLADNFGAGDYKLISALVNYPFTFNPSTGNWTQGASQLLDKKFVSFRTSGVPNPEITGGGTGGFNPFAFLGDWFANLREFACQTFGWFCV